MKRNIRLSGKRSHLNTTYGSYMPQTRRPQATQPMLPRLAMQDFRNPVTERLHRIADLWENEHAYRSRNDREQLSGMHEIERGHRDSHSTDLRTAAWVGVAACSLVIIYNIMLTLAN